MKILIIDDEEDIAKSIQLFLKDAGFDADISLSGKAALKKIPKYGLILLDLLMPDLSGRQILAEMRKKSIKVPAIVITSAGLPNAVRSEIQSYYPGTGFVSKPNLREDLLGEIKGVLKK